jgi:hypothetical protein
MTANITAIILAVLLHVAEQAAKIFINGGLNTLPVEKVIKMFCAYPFLKMQVG